MSGHSTRRATCSPVAAFLIREPVLWVWLLSSSVTPVWAVLGKHKVPSRWGGKDRGSCLSTSAGQVNAGAESSHSGHSKVQAFPGSFQGRVYYSMNTSSFQRPAFLKKLKVSRIYFFFTCSCTRLWATHPTVAHPPVGMPVTEPQQGDVSQRSFFETHNLRLVIES